MTWQEIREKVNIVLYGSKDRNLFILNVLTFIVSFLAIINMIYYHGFPVTEKSEQINLLVIRSFLGFYIFNYVFRYFYTFHPVEFLKRTWIEAVLLLFVILDIISLYLFRFPVLHNFFELFKPLDISNYYITFIQLYLLIFAGLQLGKASTVINKINLSPSSLFVFSFILLIAIGTGLLMLPQMTVHGTGMSLLSALFTSTSACCVTGLIVVDTATYFTTKGQFIIMLLCQLGGLNIITFATVFATFTAQGIGIKHQSIIQEFIASDSLFNTKKLLGQILFYTLVIELAGAILLYFLWNEDVVFKSMGSKVFNSIFHSISAFNNAGFSLFSNGLAGKGLSTNYATHFVIALLIIAGGLGFSVLRDIFNTQIRSERNMYQWKKIALHTRIVLYSSFWLILSGGIFYFWLERDYSMKGMETLPQISHSFIQSVATRSGGFNTVDISMIGIPMLIIMIFLMFIGASPGSTGGGIKTSTFAIILLSAYSTIRGKSDIEIFKHSINYDILNKAFTIVFFSAGCIFTGTIILTITDPDIKLIRLLFEEVSAFATVGLSTGITSALSEAGKVVLIASMFIGRVGILTLAFSLSSKTETNKYKYPDADFMVG